VRPRKQKHKTTDAVSQGLPCPGPSEWTHEGEAGEPILVAQGFPLERHIVCPGVGFRPGERRDPSKATIRCGGRDAPTYSTRGCV